MAIVLSDDEGKVRPVDRGYVYFVLSPTNGLVKIGFSKSYPDARLNQLRIGSPVPLERLAYFYATRRHERRLHRRFDHLWSHGEWFKDGPEIREAIRQRRGKEWVPLGRKGKDPTPLYLGFAMQRAEKRRDMIRARRRRLKKRHPVVHAEVCRMEAGPEQLRALGMATLMLVTIDKMDACDGLNDRYSIW
jgi:hypothetical protein